MNVRETSNLKVRKSYKSESQTSRDLQVLTQGPLEHCSIFSCKSEA